MYCTFGEKDHLYHQCKPPPLPQATQLALKAAARTVFARDLVCPHERYMANIRGKTIGNKVEKIARGFLFIKDGLYDEDEPYYAHTEEHQLTELELSHAESLAEANEKFIHAVDGRVRRGHPECFVWCSRDRRDP